MKVWVFVPLLFLLCIPEAAISAEQIANQEGWQVLQPGLALGQFTALDGEEPTIAILRIEPQKFRLKLLTSSAPGQGRLLTARQWCAQENLIAAINASMYQSDLQTSVGLMCTGEHVNNSYVSKDKAVLAFDRLDSSLPEVQIIDRECQNFEVLRKSYRTLVQSIRMVSCTGRNVWQQDTGRWTTAAVGMDKAGNVFFIHARSALATREFINMLLSLPINLQNAMYAEGGPQAQLYVKSGQLEGEWVGSREIAHGIVDSSFLVPKIPNVIGVVPR